jgi:tetratricopeptide (TPR) repeat protein
LSGTEVPSASFLGPILQPVAADIFQLNQAIEALRAYSLVRRDPRGKVLSIHRLVQAVLQDKMEEAEQQCWAERAVLAISAAFPQAKYETRQQCERLLSQALLAAYWSNIYQFCQAEVARLLYETATYLQDRARYQEAEPLYLRALRIREQPLEPEYLQVATSLDELAILYSKQSKYVEAEPLYLRALAIRKQELGPEHPETAEIMHGLALFRDAQNDSEEARIWYARALEVREQVLGVYHPKTVQTRKRFMDENELNTLTDQEKDDFFFRTAFTSPLLYLSPQCWKGLRHEERDLYMQWHYDERREYAELI